MQKVDKQIVTMLIDHFEELDVEGSRLLKVGLHIPSKQQAEEMKLEIKNTNKMTLKEAWNIKKKKLMQELGYDENNKLASRVSLRKAVVAETISTPTTTTTSPSKTAKLPNKELEMTMTSATTDDHTATTTATAKQKKNTGYDIDNLPVDNSAMKTLKKKSVTTLKSAKAEHIGVSI